MSSKDLQRVTECVSYIGQTFVRRSLPVRRHHITQKVKIAGQRTLYLSVHDDKQQVEVFLRVKGPDCSDELIGLYDVEARVMSLTLQYDAPLEKGDDLFARAKRVPSGPVVGHDRLKHSPRDVLSRHQPNQSPQERTSPWDF